jgi:NNP family nitrate/nitrite transporter-like MFS transporter
MARVNEDSGRLKALILATLAFFTCFYVWALYGPLSPTLQHSLKLNELQVGWLVAIPVILGSLMRVPMGVLTDRYGARRTFPPLMGFSILTLLALAVWHSTFASLIGFGFLMGFAGSSFAVGVPYVSRWYSKERQGFALGVYGMGMGGTVLTGLTAPSIAQAWGLSAPFLVGAAAVAMVGLGFLLLAEEPPTPRPVVKSWLAPFKVFRSESRAWALTLFYFVAFGGFVAMFLYLPKLLVGVYGLSKPDAGARAAGFALVAVLARPIGGYLSDRFGAQKVLAVCFGGTALLAAVLAGTYQSMVPLTVSCLAMAAMLGLGTGAVFKLVAGEFPTQVGAVTGVVGAAGGLGGFFPPLVMAWVKSTTGTYTFGFALLAVTALVCLAVLWSLRSRATRRVAAGAG